MVRLFISKHETGKYAESKQLWYCLDRFLGPLVNIVNLHIFDTAKWNFISGLALYNAPHSFSYRPIVQSQVKEWIFLLLKCGLQATFANPDDTAKSTNFLHQDCCNFLQ